MCKISDLLVKYNNLSKQVNQIDAEIKEIISDVIMKVSRTDVDINKIFNRESYDYFKLWIQGMRGPAISFYVINNNIKVMHVNNELTYSTFMKEIEERLSRVIEEKERKKSELFLILSNLKK